MGSPHQQVEPIAVIGIGLRLPGGVSTTDEFWDLLVNGRDGKCRVPSDRYNVDAFHSKGRHPLNVATEHGYFLNHTDVYSQDNSHFSVAEGTDPQQRLLCEVVWECLENAGHADLRGTNAGVFVGCFGEDWHNIIQTDKQLSSINRVLSGGDFVLSNRISYEFDIRGPSITVRTACSASISALHMACQALRAGDCPTAIVGGTSLIMEPSMTLDMSRSGVLSPSGTCKTFDATADGFARGEAINALLIKPLKDAVRDGDPIRAVIRSTSVNADGKLSRVGCPSRESQVSAIHRAYKVAGIDDFSQTPFIECHGTGTPVGDPIEVAAVADVFGKRGDTYIGSVKPNVGHGEGASGITSIIKAILSLEKQTIPPNIFFSKPSPRIPLDKYKLKVPVEPVPWPRDRHERVSVNSFGIGGANAHVILDSAASFGLPRRATKLVIRQGQNETVEASVNGASMTGISVNGTADECRNGTVNGRRPASGHTASNGIRASNAANSWPRLLPVSASSVKSLQKRADGLREYMKSRPDSAGDVAHTLGAHRMHLSHRAFCVLEDGVHKEPNFGPPEKANASPGGPKVVYAFTGQGAQWSGMGKALTHGSPSFLQDIRVMDAALQLLTDPPRWKIEELLGSSDDYDTAILEKPDVAQPLCTAIQLGLVNFFGHCGVAPCAVIGHSSGEIAAAYAAGALSMSEAIVTAYLRGQVAAQSRTGGMAVVGMSRNTLAPYLVDGVDVACENSAKNVTISGDTDGVGRVLEAIKAKESDVFTRLLPVSVAYHSNHMSDLGRLYEELLTTHLSTQCATGVIYSSTYGKAAAAKQQFGPSYWKANLESPVLFHTAMKSLLQDIPDVHAILEIGSHPALQASLRQIMQELNLQTPAYIPTLHRATDSAVSAVTAAGELYTRGFPIDFSFLNEKASLLTDLPNYPWNHAACKWSEPRSSKAWRFRQHPHHELLGSRCLESSDAEPAWRNVLQLMDVSWLQDHRVHGVVIFPTAGYVAMMGEAVMQTLDSTGYVLRNFMIKSALTLSEKSPVELMTSMRPSKLTRLMNSSWFELSVYSFNGTSWVESCVAQGKAAKEDTAHSPTQYTIAPHARRITKEYFYSGSEYLGLNYGPRFRGLYDISADTERHIAAATMPNDMVKGATSYNVHPTALDCCLQLCVVSTVKGVARSQGISSLPVYMRRITVNPGRDCLLAEATMDTIDNTHQVVALSADTKKLSVLIEGMKTVPYDNGTDVQRDMHTARLEWRPDIDCLVADNLIQRQSSKRAILSDIKMLTDLAISQAADDMECIEVPVLSQFSKYVSWLKKEKDVMSQDTTETQHLASMNRETRQNLLDLLARKIHEGGDEQASIFANTICRLAEASTVSDVCTGKVEPTDAVTDDGVASLEGLYRGMVSADEFLQLCAHSNPTMAMLEVGAGLGGTTEKTLESLTSKDGTRMYGRYMCTDKSTRRLELLKQRFQGRNQMDFRVLDVDKNPSEQGFETGSFDLIVASHTFHGSASMRGSLCNLRTLLRPGGRIYIHEPVSPLNCRSLRFVLGILPDWWAGENDDRADSPYISVERWGEELRNAGFSGLETAVLDDDSPYHCCAHMTSTAAAPVVLPNAITFLYNERRHEFSLELANSFEKEGVAVQWRTLSEMDESAAAQDIISTIDLEQPFLGDISEEDYTKLISCMSHVKKGVLWLTGAAQVNAVNPDYGLIVGLARTIRSEMSIDFWTAEMQTLDAEDIAAAAAISRKFWARDPINRTMDTEFSVREGVVWIGRYHWTSALESTEPQPPKDQPKQISIGQYGDLQSLQWVPQDSVTLQKDEVEVEIRCVGLNFRDIMVSMGIVPGPRDDLGLEATGVVTRVGSAVSHVKEGDRVSAIGVGLLSTRQIVHGPYAMRIPQHLTFEEAATMRIALLTAIYALITMGQLEKGQSVLVHSAAGGVGQAAIQICQMLGAEIYATVGSEEKIEYLTKTHGIPRENIFSSRSDSFLDGMMHSTGGRGVDIVLNSLSGELLHASWQCVAKYGKMMEIGKRDIIEQGSLPMSPFGHNRTFYGIDLLGVLADRPSLSQSLMDQYTDLVASNAVKPIKPIHIFPASKVSEAFRFMQKGQHIGKVVVSLPLEAEKTLNSKQLPLAKAIQSVSLSASGTYLIIGGLGGLGRVVATWLVEKGARSFMFLSRSAGKHEGDQDFFQELKSQGCAVAAVAGSVAEIADVKRTIATSPSPIVGVLQMSMVYRESPLLKLGYDDWKAVQDPKVKGTWNLHHALCEANAKLDFFILFSSISGIIGHPYQATYCSANTFLGSFAQFRNSLGLPCSVIDLGGVEGIGFLADKSKTTNQYRESGLFLLREQEVIDSVHLSLVNSLPSPEPEYVFVGDNPSTRNSRSPYTNLSQIAVGLKSTKSLSDPRSSAFFRTEMRYGMYGNMESANYQKADPMGAGLQKFLKMASDDPHLLTDPATLGFVCWEVGRTLFKFMQVPEEQLDIKRTLASIGIDSLVSIEIRNWWRRMLGLDTTVLEIMNAVTIEGLGKLAISMLQEKHGVKPACNGE